MDRAKIKSVVCATCLSSDRRLLDDKSLSEVLLLFPKFITLDLEEDRLCWECHALLKKLWNFHQRALAAQEMLTRIINNHNASISKSLSNLKRSKIRGLVSFNPIPIHITSVKTSQTPLRIKRPVASQKPNTSNENVAAEIPVLKVRKDLMSPVQIRVTSKPLTKAIPVEPQYVQKQMNIENIFTRLPRTGYVFNEKESAQYCNIEIASVKTEVPDSNDPLIDINSENFYDFDNQIKESKIFKQSSKHSDTSSVDMSNINEPDSFDAPIISMSTHISNLEKVINSETNLEKVINSETNLEAEKVQQHLKSNKSIVQKELQTEQDVRELLERDRYCEFFLGSKFKCRKCVCVFNEKGSYKAHQGRHRKSYGLEACRVCDLKFKDDDSLQVHYKTHFNAFECTACSFRSGLAEAAAAHDYFHGSTAPLTCNKCSEQYYTALDLRRHHTRAHSEPFECDTCGKSFRQKFTLTKHLLIHEGMPIFDCEICGKSYRGKNGINIHMKTKHSGEDDNKMYHCKPCDRSFNAYVKYHDHLRKSKLHASTKYECDYCRKIFHNKSYLQYHIMAHANMKNYECKLCHKSFVMKSQVTKHLKCSHADKSKVEKKHVCGECGKAFEMRAVLRRHLRVHTGEKPHQCQYCPWKFAQSSTLRTHHKLKHKDIERPKRNNMKLAENGADSSMST